MNCTHTTMFPKVKRVIKKLIKGNSFLIHENDPNGCSCWGGSIENLSLEELLALMKDGTFLKSYEIEKLYTWTFDKVKVYGVPLEHAKGCLYLRRTGQLHRQTVWAIFPRQCDSLQGQSSCRNLHQTISGDEEKIS